ncbi:UNVERIFIED_CONTAM: hypothetical protein FKN15_045268 [Acipenser sinensis]
MIYSFLVWDVIGTTLPHLFKQQVTKGPSATTATPQDDSDEPWNSILHGSKSFDKHQQ